MDFRIENEIGQIKRWGLWLGCKAFGHEHPKEEGHITKTLFPSTVFHQPRLPSALQIVNPPVPPTLSAGTIVGNQAPVANHPLP